jgi:hypothetical protein
MRKGERFSIRKDFAMASAIDSNGYLEFAQDDNMIRRLTDLGIEWDEKEVRIADIDLSDNCYQTRIDAGSTDEEFVLRYKNAYLSGERLPMTLVVVPYSQRNNRDCKASVCAGRHRLEGARRAGAKSATFLRALPKHQGDIDALRDLSLFDNAANGKSISSDETYSYCAHEVIAKNGGLSAGMPDAKFITKCFRRWDGRGITKPHLTRHIKALLAKMRCNSIGLATPAGLVEHFSSLWSWASDPGFDAIAKAVCPAANQPDVWKALAASKKKPAAEALSAIANAVRGYHPPASQHQDAATVMKWRCRDMRKLLSKLDSDMALDFATLDSIESQIEDVYNETHDTVARLRAKLGGLVHA